MIAIDNTQSGRALNGNSYPYLAGTGVHMLLATQSNVTAVTYGGVGLTNISTFSSPIADGNGQSLKVWELASAPSGTNNFVFTLPVLQAASYAVVTYTGMGSTQPDNSTSDYSHTAVPLANTQVATFSSSITSNADNCWSVMFIVGGANAANVFTGGAGTTLRTTYNNSADTVAIGILDSNAPITPAGSSTLTANWSAGSSFVSTTLLTISPETVAPPASASNGLLAFF